jgi:hypothetical protein
MAKTKKTENERLHEPDVRDALIAEDVPRDELEKAPRDMRDKDDAPVNPKPKE